MRRLIRSASTVLRAILAIAIALFAGTAGAQQDPVAIVFLGASDSAAARGARLGLDEANRQGRYFGTQFRLQQVAESPDGTSPLPDAPIVIAGSSVFDARPLARIGRLVLNATSERDPETGCAENVFHVGPSPRMRARAAERWGEEHPDADASPPSVVAWHPSLVRFAARDLNARYREAHGEAMASEAWAGWASARIAGEAVLRTGSAEPSVLSRYLRDELRFDGQKGAPLRFGRSRELIQPLYLVLDGRVSGDRVVGGGDDAAEDGSCRRDA